MAFFGQPCLCRTAQPPRQGQLRPGERTRNLGPSGRFPIETWNYKAQDESIRHIGPMAQDFYAAFNVGEHEKFIGSMDADGVALAAIQGLYEIAQEKEACIAEQEAEITARQI